MLLPTGAGSMNTQTNVCTRENAGAWFAQVDEFRAAPVVMRWFFTELARKASHCYPCFVFQKLTITIPAETLTHNTLYKCGCSMSTSTCDCFLGSRSSFDSAVKRIIVALSSILANAELCSCKGVSCECPRLLVCVL